MDAVTTPPTCPKCGRPAEWDEGDGRTLPPSWFCERCILDVKPVALPAAFQALRDAGGNGWDKVEDPATALDRHDLPPLDANFCGDSLDDSEDTPLYDDGLLGGENL